MQYNIPFSYPRNFTISLPFSKFLQVTILKENSGTEIPSYFIQKNKFYNADLKKIFFRGINQNLLRLTALYPGFLPFKIKSGSFNGLTELQMLTLSANL